MTQPRKNVPASQSSTVRLRYRGRARKLVANGITDRYQNAAELAKHLFDQGWATAEIMTMDGTLVGGVTTSFDRRRKRTWWGES